MYSGISNLAEFKEALLAPIRDVKIRVTALSSTLVPIEDVTPSTIEGSVYVDTSRSTRRTCQLRLVDRDGAYTPENKTSAFYWDKLIKIEYGLKVGNDYTYVPLGIFAIDRVEILAEKGAAVINIDGSDLWKRFATASFASSSGWANGTKINTVISDIATLVGVTKVTLDPLVNRAASEQQTNITLRYDLGDNIGEKLKSWCDLWSIDIYFDVNGNLVTRDKTQPPYVSNANIAPDASFTSGENAIMLGISKSQSADTLYNYIVVTGDNADGVAAVRGEYIEGTGTDVSTSPLKRKYTGNTNNGLTISEIGSRVKIIRTTTLKTSQQCLDRARVELANNLVVEEQVRLPAIVNPLFEGYDIISITETNVKLTNQTYTLDAFDVPMRSSRQELVVKKTRAL